MRLFVAVELDEMVRAAAARAAEDLRRRVQRLHLDARWVAEDQLHFTLVFIGHVADDRVASFVAAIQQPFARAPFVVRLGGCGVFPPSGPPRVLWIGVSEGAGALRDLHGDVTARLERLEFEPERRPFSAHLTLARVKDMPRSAAREARAIVRDAPVAIAECTVTRVTLFRSHLSPKGSRYEPLAHGELQRASA